MESLEGRTMTTTDENPNRVDWLRSWRNPVHTDAINASCDLVELCYAAAIEAGHYNDPKTGKPIKYTVSELVSLVMGELQEASDSDMAGEMNKHLPHRLGVEVEIADALIILFGACGHLGLDIGNAMAEKLEYNRTRKDRGNG